MRYSCWTSCNVHPIALLSPLKYFMLHKSLFIFMCNPNLADEIMQVIGD